MSNTPTFVEITGNDLRSTTGGAPNPRIPRGRNTKDDGWNDQFGNLTSDPGPNEQEHNDLGSANDMDRGMVQDWRRDFEPINPRFGRERPMR